MYHYTDVPLPWDYLCKYSLLLSNDLAPPTLLHLPLQSHFNYLLQACKNRSMQFTMDWGVQQYLNTSFGTLHGNLIAACRQNIRAGDVKVTTNCTGDTELNNS